jgi:hypothetical protein
MKIASARAFLAVLGALSLGSFAAGQQPRLRGVRVSEEPSAAPEADKIYERTVQQLDAEGADLDDAEDDWLFDSLDSSSLFERKMQQLDAEGADLKGAEDDWLFDWLDSSIVFDRKAQQIDAEGADEVEDLDSRALQGLVMSDLERKNAGYIQSFRKARGLPALSFSSDLVLEARMGHVANRERADLNVALPWSRIGELPGKYQSVALSGAASSLRNHPYLMDARYNRIGVGIAKSAKDGAYYLTILLKQV